MSREASNAAKILNTKIGKLFESAAAYDKNTRNIAKLNAIMAQNAKEAQAIVSAAAGVTNTYKSAEASASVFSSELKRQAADFERVARSNQEYMRSLQQANLANKSAEGSASVFSSELRRQEADFERVAKANQEYMRSLQQSNLANKSAEASASVFEQELRKQEAAIDRLAMKYKPLYASSKQYENALDELNRAHRLGVLNTKQHENAVERLTAEYQQFQNGTAGWSNQFVTGGQRSARSMNRFGMVAQQVGYQVGDFFVQVQSGQNVLVAFAQQGTQLAGLLPGITGAIVGIGLSGAAMVFNMLRARDNTDEFDEALKSARDTAKEIRDEIDLIGSGMQDATEKQFVDNIARAQAELNKQLEQVYLQSSSEDTRRVAQLRVSDAQEAYDLAVGELDAFRIMREYLDDVRKISEERKNQEEATMDALRSQETAYSSIISDLRLRNDIANMTFGLTGDALKAAENDVEIHKLRLALLEAGVQPMSDQWNTAISLLQTMQSNADAAAILADNLRDAASAMSALSSFGDGVERALAVANAQVVALRTGTDAATAGVIAGMRAELSANTAAALASGANDPIQVRAEAAITSAQIDELEAARLEAARIRSAGTGTTGSAGGGGGASNVVDINAILDARRQQIEQERVLLGLSGQQRAAMEVYYELIKQIPEEQRDGASAVIMAEAEKIAAMEQTNAALEAQLELQQQVADIIGSSMSNAFMSIVDGTKSVADAFKEMAASIIKELYEVLVVQQLVGSFDASTGTGSGIVGLVSSAFTGLLNANGNAFSGGNVIPFANGGVVGSPTTFPMSGGRTGLMGEAGPEAIMPLKRGKDGRLGVSAEGGGGAVTIVQNFNIAANGDESVKRIVRAETPRMAEAAKAAVLDAKRRGGAYGRGF